MKKGSVGVALFLVVSMTLLLSGCERSVGPSSGTAGIQTVGLSAAFSNGAASPLMKTAGILSTDSLHIDSAVVVFQRIKFEVHIDSVRIDTTGGHDSDDNGLDDDLIFKGLFVVHVRDTTSIAFASQVLPAGTYDGIKFKIHRIGPGEFHEDSDDFNHMRGAVSDTGFAGSSIVVWGQVRKNNVWVPFVYRFNDEVEYKLPGSFTVLAATSSLNVVLRFNTDVWFRNTVTGALLDPTDGSLRTQELIERAIRQSFQVGTWGRDGGHHEGHE